MRSEQGRWPGVTAVSAAAYLLTVSLACGWSGRRAEEEAAPTVTEQAPVSPPQPVVVTEGAWTLTLPPEWTLISRDPEQGGRALYTHPSVPTAMIKIHSMELLPTDDIELLAALNHRTHRERGHRMLPMRRQSYAGVEWLDVEYTADTPIGVRRFIWRIANLHTGGISMECFYPEGDAATLRPVCDSIMMSARRAAAPIHRTPDAP